MKKINNSAGRVGASLKNRTAHGADHTNYSRRSFLRSLSALGTGALVLNQLPVSALGMSPLSMALTGGDEDRVLVMVRLKGGNDGLNTLIPIHDFGTYQTSRPGIHIPRAEAIELTPTLALHPQLRPLDRMWNDGKMRVVQNVGYADQNLSHFRSGDIWATASDPDDFENSGVMGRYISELYPDFLTNLPETPPAIQIGGTGNLLFNNEDDFNYAISTENPTQLYNIASTGQLHDVDNLPECTYGEQLGYIRAVANTTFRYASVLSEAFDAGSNANGTEYVNDRLGDQLALIARLLKGGLRTRLFVVEIDGFDTHANQPDSHARLMNSLSNNMATFFSDLGETGHDERVLGMTFSEFGRRIEQNGSQGTDHGAAAPLLLFGPGLNGNGEVGGTPDLQNVTNNGNLRYRVDFRSVYATVMSEWLCIDGTLVDEVLGGTYERIDLGLECQGTTSVGTAAAPSIGLKAYVSGSDVVLEYELPTTTDLSVRFFDAAGREISAPFRGRRPAGVQQQRLSLSTINYAAGVFIASVETGGRVYSSRIALFR